MTRTAVTFFRFVFIHVIASTLRLPPCPVLSSPPKATIRTVAPPLGAPERTTLILPNVRRVLTTGVLRGEGYTRTANGSAFTVCYLQETHVVIGDAVAAADREEDAGALL